MQRIINIRKIDILKYKNNIVTLAKSSLKSLLAEVEWLGVGGGGSGLNDAWVVNI